jgi:HK97 family phage prohead protease
MTNLVCSFAELTASTDLDTRVIAGLAVPYGEVGFPGGTFAGAEVSFLPGSLTRSVTERGSKTKLIVDHDRTRPVGKLTGFDDRPDGLRAEFSIVRTPAGDAVLAEADGGVRDSFSIGCDVIDYLETRNGIQVVEARLIEVSLVSFPAFASAAVERVAATQQTPARGIDPRSVRFRLTLKG